MKDIVKCIILILIVMIISILSYNQGVKDSYKNNQADYLQGFTDCQEEYLQ